MTIPFERFAWLTALAFLPAAVTGWIFSFTGWWSVYPWALGLAFFALLVFTPLSWSDHITGNLGKGMLGCLGFPLVVAACVWGLVKLGHNSLILPVLYLAPSMVVSLADPRGITCMLLLLNGFVASGLAVPWATPGRTPGLVLGCFVLSFVLGTTGSLVRRLVWNQGSRGQR